MNTTVKLDKRGRIVIPKPLRDELRLLPGDSLALEAAGDQITLRRMRSGSAMREEHGVWVFRSGAKASAAETARALDNLRRERNRKNERA
ncbi:MAG: AbrB/MazE/SpoVT family DNA-binding domain-containing protein [Nitrococcus sp.]|nr:AbrB/MazE/SpoVT family DNA-binding domain-containing protein [Nitrococcus sp.]